MRRTFGTRVGRGLVVASATAMLGCASESAPDYHGSEESPGVASSALTATDPVSKAVTDSCSTASVAGLSVQLVDEIQCLRPGTFARIDGLANVSLGSAVFPYLQAPAASALEKSAAERGTKLGIISALRTLPQQYLLYAWYKAGRCGIPLAASPGTSNHESGLAVDVSDTAGWRSALTTNGFRWLGSNDPAHYDFVAGGVGIRGLSVLAFQRLWNRNNPSDRIDEDGSYGPATADRLAKSPIGGFATGASCPEGGAPIDAGLPPEPSGADLPQVPEGNESTASDAPPSDDGCATAPGRSSAPPPSLAIVASAAVVAIARRRSRRACR